MILRFGLYGREPMTLVQIGKIYNTSHELVRQWEQKAFKKIRMNIQPSEFVEYMQNSKDTIRRLNEYRNNPYNNEFEVEPGFNKSRRK